MEGSVRTRLGDGSLLEMTPSEIRADVLDVPINSVARFEECAGLRARPEQGGAA